ncbi:hypothetical protein CEQ90_01085 [Lewinellaceae bacterium SD302]|nr:hypothetical protein CEQ90_01085 [Lewinellaceae bacterium SD302]
MLANSPTTETLQRLRQAQETAKSDPLWALKDLLGDSGLTETEKGELRLLQTRLNELLRNRLAGMISTDFEYRESQTVKSDLLSWLGNAVNHYGKLAEEAALTWPELKAKLLAIQENNGFLPACDLITQLVYDRVTRDALASLERDYDDFVWSLNDTLGEPVDWGRNYASLNRRLATLIQDFDATGLKAGWEGKYREAIEDFDFRSEGEVFALISRRGTVQVPAQIVTPEAQQSYKRLIYHYQDAFAVGDYTLAYDTLIKARYELEVESAQLYEYLLLSYFKKTGEKTIVQQIVNGRSMGEPDHLRHLLLYAGRSLEFQDSTNTESDRHPLWPHRLTDHVYSDTAEYNVRQISRGLLLRLCEAMAKLKFNYLEEGLLAEENPLFRKLTNLLRAVGRINRYLSGDILFAEQVIIELSGGHRNQWITVAENGRHLEDRYPNFPARKLLRHARRFYAFSVDDQDEAEHRIAEDVAIQLADKYESLVVQAKLGLGERHERAQAMTVCLNTFRAAALLYPKDRLFFDTPLRELLNGESGLNWYQFTASGNLQQREELLSVHTFNVLDHLQYLITEKYGQESWELYYAELRKAQYERLIDENGDLLDRINSQDYRVRDATPTSVSRAVEYLRNCETLYHVYGDVQHLENGFQEIVGNNNFHWFEVGQTGLVAARPKNDPDFNAGLYLNRILRERPEITLVESNKVIAKNYFRLHIERRYRELLVSKEKYGSLKDEEAAELADLLEAAAVLYTKVHHEPQYRDFVLTEFVEERLLRYLDVDDNELLEHVDAIKAGVDVMFVLTAFREINDTDLRLDPMYLLTETVYNRKVDMDRYYEREFHRLRRHNYLDEDRLRMIELIDRYYRLSQLVNDRNLLEIPYKEYVLNRGKVRWGWSLIPSIGFQRPIGFFQHWRNGNIPDFSFRLQRAVIKRAYRNTPVVIREEPLKRLGEGSEQAARLREDIANV